MPPYDDRPDDRSSRQAFLRQSPGRGRRWRDGRKGARLRPCSASSATPCLPPAGNHERYPRAGDGFGDRARWWVRPEIEPWDCPPAQSRPPGFGADRPTVYLPRRLSFLRVAFVEELRRLAEAHDRSWQ